MVFMRAFLRGVLLFIAVLAASVWVVAATFQSTIFNREMVKLWGAESGAYSNIVQTLEIRQVDATGFIQDATLRQAMTETLTPAYIQEQAEIAVDAFYDWVSGEATEVAYTIPLHEQHDEFIANLAGQLEAKISGLPECTGTLSLEQECIPRAYTTESYAVAIAEQTANDSDLFKEAIVVEDMKPTGVVAALPIIASWSAVASWLLLIVAVVTGAGYVLLSRDWRAGVASLGRRLVFSTVILVVLGLLAWLFGGSLNLATRLFGGSDTSLITGVIEPILNQTITAIGMWLTIWGGCVLVVGVVLWVVGFILQRGGKNSPGLASGSKPTVSSAAVEPPKSSPVALESTRDSLQSVASTSQSPLVSPDARRRQPSIVPPTKTHQQPASKPRPVSSTAPSRQSSSTPPIASPRNAPGSVNSNPRPESSRPPRRSISL